MNNTDIKIKQILLDDNKIPDKYYKVLNETLSNLPQKNTFSSIVKKTYLKIILLITLITSLSSVGVYAGVKLYDKYIQNNISIQNEEKKSHFSLNYSYITEEYINMNMLQAKSSIIENNNSLEVLYNQKVYYKKIYNYNEYLDLKSKWNNTPEINNNDLNNNFILLIGFNSERFDGIKITNIYNESNKLIINLEDIDGNGSRYENTLFTLINKEMDSDNIFINIIPGSNLTEQFGYTKLSNITKENINILMEKEKWIKIPSTKESKEKKDSIINQIDTFISKEEPKMIRIINGNTKIKDLIYINGQYMYYDVLFNNNTWEINELSFIKNQSNILEKIEENYNNFSLIHYYFKYDTNYPNRINKESFASFIYNF